MRIGSKVICVNKNYSDTPHDITIGKIYTITGLGTVADIVEIKDDTNRLTWHRTNRFIPLRNHNLDKLLM